MKLKDMNHTKRLVRRAAFHRTRPNRGSAGVFDGFGVVQMGKAIIL